MKKIIIKSQKHGRFEALLDDDDYERAKDIGWQIFKGKKRVSQYAQRWVRTIYTKKPIGPAARIHEYEWMHHFVLGKRKGMVVDHIDGNGLNNQKSNLRFCTQRQNMLNLRINTLNTSGYKGVHFCNREKKWVAAIVINGKKKFLGYFKTAEEGHAVWKKKSIETRGEFHAERWVSK